VLSHSKMIGDESPHKECNIQKIRSALIPDLNP
jgi:hypothetical protein